jgi:acetoin:2,6-dichlorophenolindophenol oxidoreductase subunit alpha
MIRIRLFEESLAELYRRGQLVGVVHLSIGQEATAVGVCSALRGGDQITSTHRGHHHMLARGLDPQRMFAEILGRAGGFCRGKGGSMHVSAPAEGVVGANGIVGGGIPHAVGLAFAAKQLGRDAVAVAFFGDGAANQGVLFESLNLAALWQAPVIFVCENNGFTEFTPTDAVTCGESIAARTGSFGVPGFTVDGDDVAEVHEAATRAIEQARSGEGPSFIESRTHRWRGHHEGEESYARPYREPVESPDPIDRLERTLAEAGFEARALRELLEGEEKTLVQHALTAAEAEPEPPIHRAFEDVFV